MKLTELTDLLEQVQGYDSYPLLEVEPSDIDATIAALRDAGFYVAVVERLGSTLEDSLFAICQALGFPKWFRVVDNIHLLKDVLFALEKPSVTGYVLLFRDVRQLEDQKAWSLLIWVGLVVGHAQPKVNGVLFKMIFPSGSLDAELMKKEEEGLRPWIAKTLATVNA